MSEKGEEQHRLKVAKLFLEDAVESFEVYEFEFLKLKVQIQINTHHLFPS